MSSCELLVGSRVLLRAEGGAPEAEYALFDEGEIELQAISPGSNREVGYRTTVARASERLTALGITPPFAEAAALVVAADVKLAYARGPLVRRIASYLGAAELFDGSRYDARGKTYAGGWLDLASLARDVRTPFAAAAMQALHLRALLAECDPHATVFLSTEALSRDRRPGERSYKRPILDGVRTLPDALRALRAPDDRLFALDGAARGGPGRDELLEGVRARIALASTAVAQTRLVVVERGLTMRERPDRGPLSDPAVWALEVQLTMGDSSGVIARAEAIERGRGRQPATAYLRSRAALIAGTEDPRAIAERVSALAQSMSNFGELVLLAAQAWAAANELTKAHAFARLVADDPQAGDELRARARDIASDSAAGRRPMLSFAPAPLEPLRVDKILESRPSSRPRRVMNDPRSERPSPMPRPRVTTTPPAPPAPAAASPVDAPIGSAPDTTVDTPQLAFPTSAPPPRDTDQDVTARRDPSDVAIPRMPPPPTIRRPYPFDQTPTLNVADDARPLSPSPSRSSPPPRFAGASQPPILTVAPKPRTNPPRGSADFAPRPSLATPTPVERVERLSLPPGLHGQMPRANGDASYLPASPSEARVAFTHMARGLAREYRERYSYELRTDIASLDFMQRELLDRYPDGLASSDDALDVRPHGAFLSEMIARTLGGYWQDIGPTEIGYWTMIVPTRTRVLPFGRIFRFVSLGPKDRDLAGYYRDLQERARMSSPPTSSSVARDESERLP